MNILHMKYAYEVAKAGSLGKAAETLVIAAPNLSRSIKELESELGITIFDRTPKGMFLTSEGEVFMNYAHSILEQIDYLENAYTGAKMMDDVEMMMRLSRAIMAFDYDRFDHTPTWEEIQESYMMK